MEKTIQRPRKEQKSFIRRVAKQLFKRQESNSRTIYDVGMQDNAVWEMSASDALLIPLTSTTQIPAEFHSTSAADDSDHSKAPTADTQLLDQTYADVSDLALDESSLMPAFETPAANDDDNSQDKDNARKEPVRKSTAKKAASSNARPAASIPKANKPIAKKSSPTKRSKPASMQAKPAVNQTKPIARQAQGRTPDEDDSDNIPQLTNQVTSPTRPTSVEKAGARLTHFFEPGAKDRLLPEKQPSSEERSGFQAAAKKIKAARASNEIVLLVEPNPKVRSALANMVKTMGVRCLPVGSAKEALNFLHRFRPSVILLDQNLTDMSTPEVVICMRGLYRTRPVPIVLMSEEDTELFSDWSKRMDINHYLAKPFNIYGLERAIGRYAKVKPPKSDKPYAGSVGLIVERPELRHYISRFLVRHNYSISVSCDPDKLKHATEFAQQQPLDAWLVQCNDEDWCADIVEDLETNFDSPVFIGFDDLDPTTCDDRQKLCWNGRLLDKLGKLLTNRKIQAAGQVA
ncbi:response regulator [Hahella ganghwensis]|uniref:response regulator n=1 Tax=Hahella ganghwensis TaxID=286420 RepID=UPI000363205D|nr:response regulator [Hahella ganghwensis]